MNIWCCVDKLTERQRKKNGKQSGHGDVIFFPIPVEVELLKTGGRRIMITYHRKSSHWNRGIGLIS
jgi:hypothetical protein